MGRCLYFNYERQKFSNELFHEVQTPQRGIWGIFLFKFMGAPPMFKFRAFSCPDLSIHIDFTFIFSFLFFPQIFFPYSPFHFILPLEMLRIFYSLCIENGVGFYILHRRIAQCSFLSAASVTTLEPEIPFQWTGG